MKKKKTERYWYRRPREEIITEHLYSDGNEVTVGIVVGVCGETPWRINSYTDKVKKLLMTADRLGFKLLDVHQEFKQIEGIKTKKVQEQERWEEEFRKAVFYECGAQQYL